jgi:hypothetical protein
LYRYSCLCPQDNFSWLISFHITTLILFHSIFDQGNDLKMNLKLFFQVVFVLPFVQIFQFDASIFYHFSQLFSHFRILFTNLSVTPTPSHWIDPIFGKKLCVQINIWIYISARVVLTNYMLLVGWQAPTHKINERSSSSSTAAPFVVTRHYVVPLQESTHAR